MIPSCDNLLNSCELRYAEEGATDPRVGNSSRASSRYDCVVALRSALPAL
jgi:hypothetical protein